MREIKDFEELACYNCGDRKIKIGIVIGENLGIPLRFICINCIIKMHKIMFGDFNGWRLK